MTLSFKLLVLSTTAAVAGSPPAGYPERLADAIYRAEGGTNTRYPYGVMSVKVKGVAEARRVCLVSITNNWRRWEASGRTNCFITHLTDRWCPSKTDKKGNENWNKNIHIMCREDIRKANCGCRCRILSKPKR
jgi:hypothetical protein